jgi:hypothetical protein
VDRTFRVMIVRCASRLRVAAEGKVTVATLPEQFDPDNPSREGAAARTTVIAPARLPLPTYIDLRQLTSEERASVLLASAALPFGIFPRVTLWEQEYVDGGVADNLPIHPLLDCDELIVVRVSPSAAEHRTLRQAWQFVDRRLRLEEKPANHWLDLYAEKHGRAHNILQSLPVCDPPAWLPLREPPSWPARCIVIAPQNDLGGFVGGTLNFSGEFARSLLELGYKDATAVIRSHFPQAAAQMVQDDK